MGHQVCSMQTRGCRWTHPGEPATFGEYSMLPTQSELTPCTRTWSAARFTLAGVVREEAHRVRISHDTMRFL
jgi:hypothetical protein